MRKIEVEMLAAVRSCQPWQSGNTCVAPIPASESGTPAAHVYLHGNHIATVSAGGYVQVNRDTLKRWPTSTTVSRLRALGVDARVKGRVPYINEIRN